MGASLMLPIGAGRFALGTWQGIYLNEHRNNGGPRRLVVTIQVSIDVSTAWWSCTIASQGLTIQ